MKTFNNCQIFFIIIPIQTKEIQGKAGELYKAFQGKVTEVTNELKAKNPELFSGDIQKLQVSE